MLDPAHITPLGAALGTIAAAKANRAASAAKRASGQHGHKQITVALPADLLAQIDARASASACTRATLIKTMLAYWLALEAAQ